MPGPAPASPPRVNLRRAEARDAAARAALGVSAEVVRMFGGQARDMPRLDAARAAAWAQALMDHPHAWVIEADGALVGELRLDDLNPQDRRARLAMGLFRQGDLGRGIGRAAIGLALAQAFGPLGLHRVDLRVLAFNTRAIRCYQACGFQREGVMRQSARIGEAWADDWIMAILAPEWAARQAADPGAEAGAGAGPA